MREEKPCPFCGSESVRLHWNTAKYRRRFYYVACDVCGARTRGESIQEDQIEPEDEWGNVAALKSVACWNRRVGESDA